MEEYWKLLKDTFFYRKVSTQMVVRGHIFSPEQCKNKMDSLASDFKLYVKSLNRTGQGSSLMKIVQALKSSYCVVN